MNPQLSDIFYALMATKEYAQVVSQSHPEHAQAVVKFSEEIDRIGLELNYDVGAESASPRLPERPTIQAATFDLVNFLTVARAYAQLISQRNPECMVPLKRFQEETWPIQNELIRTIRPG
jgi:hypothetical protein